MWGQGASGGQPASSFLFGQPVAPQTAPAPAFGFGASSQAPAQAQPGAFAFGQVSAAQSAPAGAGQLLFGQPVGGAGATAAQASAPANDQRPGPFGAAFGGARARTPGPAPDQPAIQAGTPPGARAKPNIRQRITAAPADDDAEEASRRAQRAARFQNVGGAGPSAAPQPALNRSRSPSQARAGRGLGNTSVNDLSAMDDDGEATIAPDGITPIRQQPFTGGRSGTPPSATWGLSAGSAADGGDGDGIERGEDGLPVAIVGTCTLMCPEDERAERESSGLLHPLELVDPNNPRRTDASLCVKKNVRNYEPHDLVPHKFRTLPALTATVEHLCRVMDWTEADHPKADKQRVHAFLWDRFRQVRREAQTQRFDLRPDSALTVVEWNELIARWMLISSHEMVQIEGFEEHLNQEQMNKTMMDLKVMYERCDGWRIDCPNSAEFKCYLAIMNYVGLVNKKGHKPTNRLAAIEIFRTFTPHEQRSPWFAILRAVLTTLACSDVIAFWQLVRAAPFVLACVLYSQFSMVQGQGMALAAKAYDATEDPSNVIPMDALTKFTHVGPLATSGKARAYGEELPGNEFRFAYFNEDQHAPPVVQKKKLRQPWISKKNENYTIHHAASQPPQLTPAFLALIARINMHSGHASQRQLQELEQAATTAPADFVRRPGAPAASTPPRSPPSSLLTAPAAAARTPASGSGAGAFGLGSRPQTPTASAAVAPTRAQPAAASPAVPPSPAQPPTALRSAGATAAQVFGGAGVGAGTSSAPAAAAAASAAPAAAVDTAALQQALARREQEIRHQAQSQVHAITQQAKQMAEEAERRARESAMVHTQMMQQRVMEAQHATASTQQENVQLKTTVQQVLADFHSIKAENEARTKWIAKRQLKDTGERLRKDLEDALLRRTIDQWRKAVQVHKIREQRLREQLARCKVTSQPRSIDRALLLGTASKRPCRRLSLTESRIAAAAVSPAHAPTAPMRLADVLRPALQQALEGAGWAPPPGTRGAEPPRRSTPLQERPVWKLVVCSGLQAGGPQHPAPPVSATHASAAEWLRQRLSAGREVSPTITSGSVLSLLVPSSKEALTALPRTAKDAAAKVVICIEDLNASAVAAETAAIAEHGAPSLGATSAVLMLVDGPPTDAPAGGGGAGAAALPRDLAAALTRSWEQLQALLSRLPPSARVPVVLLTLTSSERVGAVKAHFQHSVQRWPAAVTARMARCQMLPLCDAQTSRDTVLESALSRELAKHPPLPFLISAGCPDPSPSSGPNSPRWALLAQSPAAGAAAAALTGPPARIAADALVQDLLDQCLKRHLPSHKLGTRDTRDQSDDARPIQVHMVDSFNASLEALSRGINATATNSLATWGLPARELVADPDAAAPACWDAARTHHAADAVLAARVPYSALTTPPAGASAPAAASPGAALAAYQDAATLLRTSFETWFAQQRLKGGPPYCMLLPRYQPARLSAAATAAADALPARPFRWVEPGASRAASQGLGGLRLTYPSDSQDTPMEGVREQSPPPSFTPTPAQPHTLFTPSASPQPRASSVTDTNEHSNGFTYPTFGGVQPIPPTPYTDQRPSNPGGYTVASPFVATDRASADAWPVAGAAAGRLSGGVGGAGGAWGGKSFAQVVKGPGEDPMSQAQHVLQMLHATLDA